MNKTIAHVLAVAGGAATWIAGSRLAGVAEAWHHPIYPSTVLPVLAVLVAMLGFWTRGTLGLGIAASLGQLVGLFLTTSGDSSLWPVGVGILALLAMPLGFVAWLGGKARGFCTRAGAVASRCRFRRARCVPGAE